METVILPSWTRVAPLEKCILYGAGIRLNFSCSLNRLTSHLVQRKSVYPRKCHLDHWQRYTLHRCTKKESPVLVIRTFLTICLTSRSRRTTANSFTTSKSLPAFLFLWTRIGCAAPQKKQNKKTVVPSSVPGLIYSTMYASVAKIRHH